MYRNSNHCFVRLREYKKKSPKTLTLVSGVSYLNYHIIKTIILSIFHSMGPLWLSFSVSWDTAWNAAMSNRERGLVINDLIMSCEPFEVNSPYTRSQNSRITRSQSHGQIKTSAKIIQWSRFPKPWKLSETFKENSKIFGLKEKGWTLLQLSTWCTYWANHRLKKAGRSQIPNILGVFGYIARDSSILPSVAMNSFSVARLSPWHSLSFSFSSSYSCRIFCVKYFSRFILAFTSAGTSGIIHATKNLTMNTTC